MTTPPRRIDPPVRHRHWFLLLPRRCPEGGTPSSSQRAEKTTAQPAESPVGERGTAGSSKSEPPAGILFCVDRRDYRRALEG